MPKLNDTQFVLLATAAQRDSGSLYPPPETLTAGARVSKALAALLGAGFADERETSDAAAVHRTDGDLRFGLYVTPAGLQAIGIEPEGGEQTSGNKEAQAPSPAPSQMATRETKASQVLTLLGRSDGATVAELIDATGWLPHTTRAALTGLRKKGHSIERGKRGEHTCYFARCASAA